MSRIAANVPARWQDATNLSGVTTASLLVVFLVATGIGTAMGLAIDSAVNPVVLALIAGFLGTVVAGIIRNTLLVRAWSVAGVEDAGTPLVVIVYAAVASLAGSLAAYDQTQDHRTAPPQPLQTGGIKLNSMDQRLS